MRGPARNPALHAGVAPMLLHLDHRGVPAVAGALCALVVAASLAGCSGSRSARPPADVVAQVGDRNITLKEVEEQWRKDDASDCSDATFKVYEGRRKALDELIAKELFARAAKGSGLSTDAWEEAEVSKRAKEVTDDEVRAFYET